MPIGGPPPDRFRLARATLLEQYAGYADGQYASICPICGHGPSSFSVKVDMGMLRWYCHRASCGFSGIHGVASSQVDRRKEFVPRPFDYASGPWDRIDRLFAFDGTLLGHQSRRKNEDGTKRVMTWPIVSRRLYAAYMQTFKANESLWLVEDCRSAERLQQWGASAAALLGTNVSQEWIETELLAAIRFYGIRRILVALDPGAEDAAVKARRTLTEYANIDTLVVPLKQDIKDMDGEDLSRLLEYYDPSYKNTAGGSN